MDAHPAGLMKLVNLTILLTGGRIDGIDPFDPGQSETFRARRATDSKKRASRDNEARLVRRRVDAL